MTIEGKGKLDCKVVLIQLVQGIMLMLLVQNCNYRSYVNS